jgi:hypothetical protein
MFFMMNYSHSTKLAHFGEADLSELDSISLQNFLLKNDYIRGHFFNSRFYLAFICYYFNYTEISIFEILLNIEESLKICENNKCSM